MLKIHNNLIMESLTEALETMAFMMVMPYEEYEDISQPVACTWASMHFSGPISGTIELLADQQFTETLALNLLGIDDPTEARKKGLDAFKELLNTTCGVLLPRLATPESDIFDVTVPIGEHRNQEETWVNYTTQPDVIVMFVEEFLLAIQIKIYE